MSISVVIPAYNEEKAIRGCLRSLANQDTAIPLEVIVVDNNSTDRTALIAESFRDHLAIRVIRERRKGRGAARWAGFSAAKGDIILSTDADTLVPRSWISSLWDLFERHPEIDAIGGTSFISDCSPVTNTIYNIGHPCILAGFRVLYGHDWLSGFNFGIRRRVYDAAGGFDPHTDSLEDYDLSRRVGQIARTKVFRGVKVHVSGRRYRRGIVLGLAPYLRNIMERTLLRRTRCVLADVR